MRALAMKPEILFLDEPFSGFDPINATLIKDEILELKEKGSTIIFSTHRMESVEELCDYIALINKSKKVLEGKKLEIKDQYKSNTYTLNYEGEKVDSAANFSVLSNQKNLDGSQTAVLKAAGGKFGNDLLKEILEKVTVKSFKEDVASMNDVFIKAVNESN
jgi:ABC-2 type transport system ATP-binding protein